MNIHTRIVIIVTACAVHVTALVWRGDSYFIQNLFEDNSLKMKAFVDEQKKLVQQAIDSGFGEVVKMTQSVNSYVEDQQKKITTDFNNYVESVKDNGRKVADFWSYTPNEEADSKLKNPDSVLTVPGIITRNGYPCETHTIVSQGYILNVHRISRSKKGGDIPSKTVLLQHGLLASSSDWILNGPEKALAYVLADAGYDVWMSNNRGNKYSREHAWLSTGSKAYWNFSWHDVALYDIPAVIDYIMKSKGPDTKITYIGHSMGTTILFAMLSLRPEYNHILNGGLALAPEVFLSDIKSPLKKFAPMASNLASMEMLYGAYEFIPKQSILGKIINSSHGEHIDNLVCNNVVFEICGADEEQFNKTLFPVFMAHFGAGTSWKTLLHFSQEVLSGGKFQQFDYGPYHNAQFYKSETPPEYDLSRVTLPVTLFWAKNDLLSSEKDVQMLYEKLPRSSTDMYLIPHPLFNHLDYLLAIDANIMVNQKILETLRKYNR